jgi:phosphomannomutase
MTVDTHDLITSAHNWIDGDPDPVTRAELQELIGAGSLEELGERMAGTLQFGTAGLRGRVAAGSNRMNRAVVIRATRGVADYLLGESTTGPVVVGCDARPSSRQFMEDTVGVLAAAGIPVRYFPEPTPTPIVAYEALRLEARAAIVVTASHNPPADNGYKVYASNGAQIVPPVDTGIAAAIEAVGPATEVPMVVDLDEHDLVGTLGDETFTAYLDDLEPYRARPAQVTPLKIAYTPMHGVGGKFVIGALAHAGYVDVYPEVTQFDPDGLFPTVEFPNPEEPGALDLVTNLATRVGADLIIANDPDTDRLAVSLPTADGWRPLTGNQIGILLADSLLQRSNVSDPIVINSIVSSPMLGSIAADYGARFDQTLTGFKWIWNAALDIEAAGLGTFVFGYEEALGYSVGRAVRDKDGISAAVAFADLAAACALEGFTVWDRLHALYRRHGLWVSNQVSVVRPGVEGAAEIARAMERLAADTPATLGGASVSSVTDFSRDSEDRPRYLGATRLVLLELADLGRLLVRPSGTEPKLKIYGDLRADASEVADLTALERTLLRRADELAHEMVDYLGLA